MRVVAWTSLGRYIDSLERDGELLRITREVDVELEAGTIADLLVKTGGPAVIFEKPRLPDGTISDIPLAMNIFGSHSRTMKALGAKVILTPAAERGSGMVKRAEELAKEHGWFLAKQFENPANPAYHRNTTAPEILRAFAGRSLDYFVSGWGTGGTITGTGEVLKSARPEIKIIGTEPENAALLSGNDWQPHKIQGWTPDFIPKVLNTNVTDEVILVSDEDSIATAKELAQKEGIFCGISAGATMKAALICAEKAPANSSFCVILPDTGERYLSSPLFDGISEESDDDWLSQLT